MTALLELLELCGKGEEGVGRGWVGGHYGVGTLTRHVVNTHINQEVSEHLVLITRVSWYGPMVRYGNGSYITR